MCQRCKVNATRGYRLTRPQAPTKMWRPVSPICYTPPCTVMKNNIVAFSYSKWQGSTRFLRYHNIFRSFDVFLVTYNLFCHSYTHFLIHIRWQLFTNAAQLCHHVFIIDLRKTHYYNVHSDHFLDLNYIDDDNTSAGLSDNKYLVGTKHMISILQMNMLRRIKSSFFNSVDLSYSRRW